MFPFLSGPRFPVPVLLPKRDGVPAKGVPCPVPVRLDIPTRLGLAETEWTVDAALGGFFTGVFFEVLLL